VILDQNEKITFLTPLEINWIYKKTENRLITILDSKNRKIHISKSNTLPDVVVFSPSIEKAATFTDLHKGGYLEFCCVETGNIFQTV
jgi:D-hexose-6-phosphate mutarotase